MHVFHSSPLHIAEFYLKLENNPKNMSLTQYTHKHDDDYLFTYLSVYIYLHALPHQLKIFYE